MKILCRTLSRAPNALCGWNICSSEGPYNRLRRAPHITVMKNFCRIILTVNCFFQSSANFKKCFLGNGQVLLRQQQLVTSENMILFTKISALSLRIQVAKEFDHTNSLCQSTNFMIIFFCRLQRTVIWENREKNDILSHYISSLGAIIVPRYFSCSTNFDVYRMHICFYRMHICFQDVFLSLINCRLKQKCQFPGSIFNETFLFLQKQHIQNLKFSCEPPWWQCFVLDNYCTSVKEVFGRTLIRFSMITTPPVQHPVISPIQTLQDAYLSGAIQPCFAIKPAVK